MPRTMHVWSALLDDRADDVESRRRLLSPDERERASRFHFGHDAARYVVGRSLLRELAAGYLRRAPEALRFAYGPHGKPRLESCGGLRFNVAHSGALALLAFTHDVEIGVDVELEKPLPDLHAVMRTAFAPGERERIAALDSPRAQHAAFYRCWTRKEAVLKALGSGLARPLDSFEVSTAEGAPAVIAMAHEPAAAEQWRLHHLVPAEGAVGAAAWNGPPLDVECFHHAA